MRTNFLFNKTFLKAYFLKFFPLIEETSRTVDRLIYIQLQYMKPH
jgi:hypothetical protein